MISETIIHNVTKINMKDECLDLANDKFHVKTLIITCKGQELKLSLFSDKKLKIE